MSLQNANKVVLNECKIVQMINSHNDLDIIENVSIAIEGNKISWLGQSSNLPKEYIEYKSINLEGRVVTPGLIDCHTHLVYAGDRSKEFDMRLNGKTYKQIAEAGGGIVSTVKETRLASELDLLNASLQRIDDMIECGVTTVEIKSGYGLDIETECKMLRVAREIENKRDIRIKTSFLGSHAIPLEYKNARNDYIQDVCIKALERAYKEGLVDAVDGFCENIALTSDEIEYVFNFSRKLNLPVKLHAEQLSNSGGIKLASKYNALSMDHIEYADESDVQAMSSSGSVAVILPGAFYSLNEKQKPPIELLKKYNVPIAIATDCNPGSSPMTSLLLSMNMASTLFSITPQMNIMGVTSNAAKALGLNNVGKIAEGMIADLAIWSINHPSELSYRIGVNPLYKRIFGGVI